jgi:hypothetical protein
MKTETKITGKVHTIEPCRDGSMMVEIDQSWYNVDKNVTAYELRFCELWEVLDDLIGLRMASSGFPMIKPA